MRIKFFRLIVLVLVFLLAFSISTAVAEGNESDSGTEDATESGNTAETEGNEPLETDILIDWSQYSYEELLTIRENLNEYIHEAERQYAIENGNRVISFAEAEATLYKAKTLTLLPEVKRIVEDAPQKTNFVWKSSDETVAKVSNKGVVTGIGYGDATITCSASDDEYIFAEAVVHVVLPVTGITLNKTAETLLLSDKDPSSGTAALSCTVAPENAYNQDITWKSSNPNIVTVNQNGIIVAVSPGTATITAASADPNSNARPITCKVTVLQAVSQIVLGEVPSSLNINSTLDVKTTISPQNATNKNLVWKSSNAAVASVSNTGRIKAIAPGVATITCTAADGSGVYASFSLKVVQMVTSVKIETSGKTITVNKNESVTLRAVVSPDNASKKTLAWSSSDPSIASVDKNGKVQAKQGGAVTITATAEDGSGKSASVEIFVPSIAVSKSNYSVTSKSGSDITFKYYGRSSDFTYTVSPSNICDISKKQNGETITLSITPNKAGTATVTLQDKSDRRSDTKITITIEHSACYDTTSYPTGKYSDVLRSPSSYKNKPMSIYGRVLQISTGWFSTVMRVASRGRYDDVFYIKCSNELVQGIIEDDYITIYGVCTGTETYTTILGASITIPSMEAEKIFLGKH